MQRLHRNWTLGQEKLYAQQNQTRHTNRLHELDYLDGIQYQALQKEYFLSQEACFNYIKKDLKEMLKSSIQEKRSIQKIFDQLDAFITCHKNLLNSNIAHLRLKVVSIEINALLAKLATSLKTLGRVVNYVIRTCRQLR